MSRTLLVLMAGLTSALTAGCTVTSVGQPRATNTTTSSTTSADGMPSDWPARPRELRLDDVDPCAVIPEGDYPRFYLDQPGRPRQDEQYQSPACFYPTEYGAVDVTLVVTVGIEEWLEGSDVDRINRGDPISGYGAVSIELTTGGSVCYTAVDVADGQQLLTTTQNNNSSFEHELPEPCAFARQVAESAMSTLVDS